MSTGVPTPPGSDRMAPPDFSPSGSFTADFSPAAYLERRRAIPDPGTPQFRSFARDLLLPLGRRESCKAHEIRLAGALARLDSKTFTAARVHGLLYDPGLVLHEREARGLLSLLAAQAAAPGGAPRDGRRDSSDLVTAGRTIQAQIDALSSRLLTAERQLADEKRKNRAFKQALRIALDDGGAARA